VRPEDLPQASIFHAQSVEDYARQIMQIHECHHLVENLTLHKAQVVLGAPFGKLIELRSRFVSADASTVAVEPCHRLLIR